MYQGHQQVTHRRPGGRERCAQGPGTPAGHTAQTWRQEALCTGTPAGHTAEAWRQGALCTGTRDTSGSHSADLEAGSTVHRDQGHQQVTRRRPGGRERCAQGPGSHAAGLEAGGAVHRDQGHQQVTQRRPGDKRTLCSSTSPGESRRSHPRPGDLSELCTGYSSRKARRSHSTGLETRVRCAQTPDLEPPAGHTAQAWRPESAVHSYQPQENQQFAQRRAGDQRWLCTVTSPGETRGSHSAGLSSGTSHKQESGVSSTRIRPLAAYLLKGWR
ncbi:hypothetical protein NDU88_000618 [Pleurodeles waltl]|uniref:Uncharacterized protein n=1 Tax=Pleurodeles waltl TaxID=8319 RepID=A0AAV7V670_PLEWA|nr:hypothetical protein NDU88_000618 [Pleurodeles waltl]